MAPSDENRFAFLLNPIKDLTKNWEIDLSKFLEEYLGELGQAPITFDGGETVMNFAEAAMLIQGSAGVYSRKVEFLWHLVKQMLDMLANKKQAQQTGRNKDGGAVDPNATLGFQPIDDIPICKKRFKEESSGSGGAVKYLPITPVCLVDRDKTYKTVPLISLNGDLLGNKDDYRLNYTSSSMSGMICTEMDIEALLRVHVKVSFTPTRAADLSVPPMASVSTSILDDVAATADDDGVCSGAGDGLAGDATFPSPPPTPEPPPPDPPAAPTAARVSSRLRQCAAPGPAAPPVEVWRPRDVYEDTSNRRQRPLRRGRITRPPSCLCEQRRDNRKRKRGEPPPPPVPPEPPAPPPPVFEYTCDQLFSGLTGPDGVKSSRRLTRRQLQLMNEQLRREVQTETDVCKPILAAVKLQKDESPEPAADLEDNQSDCDDQAGFHDDDDEPPPFPDPPAAAPPPTPPVDSYEELVQRRVADYLSAAQDYVQSTELSRRVAQWQETVRPRLEREERRQQFDIHEYGSKILHRFPDGDAKCTLLFAGTMAGQEPPEVARYLLSSLMLANTYNVEVSMPAGAGDPSLPECHRMDSLELTLLSRRRHHQVFDGQKEGPAAAEEDAPAFRRRSSAGSAASSASGQSARSTVRASSKFGQSRTRGRGRGRKT